MKLEIVYVFPTMPGGEWIEKAWRFVQTYHAFPPGVDHKTTVILNGPKVDRDLMEMFLTLPGLGFFEHDNSGWEIGAYQEVAKRSDADFIGFFAASTYFRLAGWLERMAQVFSVYGTALYGNMGNMGYAPHKIFPHVRTTAFWLPPGLMNACPFRVSDASQRYPFEHGENCLTEWVRRKGMKAWIVTMSDCRCDDWDNMANGFHNGNQGQLLVGDRFCEPPYFPYP